MRFLSDMVSFLTKLPSTGHEKIPVTFYEWFSVFLTEPQKLNGEVFAGTEALRTVKHFVWIMQSTLFRIYMDSWALRLLKTLQQIHVYKQKMSKDKEMDMKCKPCSIKHGQYLFRLENFPSSPQFMWQAKTNWIQQQRFRSSFLNFIPGFRQSRF